MRVKIVALTASLLVLIAVAATAAPGDSAGARLQETEASPAASPAAVTPEAEPEEPEAEPTVDVVTLVAWYQPDESGDVLLIGPIRTNSNLVAGPAEPGERDLSGDVNFEDQANDGLPRIRIGQSAFEAYQVFGDDPNSVQRWIYFDGDPELRPATLVMQVVATKGPYDGYVGSATFVSRAPAAGGVLIIVLNPPDEE